MLDWAKMTEPKALRDGSADAAVAPPRKRGRIVRLGTKIGRAATAEQTLALLDQAVVSGASFLTTVMIGRYTDASELGTYALAAWVLIWLTNAQEAFIALPYTLHQDRSPASAKVRTGHALVFCVALSVLAVFGIAVFDLFMPDSKTTPHLVAIMWCLAAVAPFVIHRDFARRHAFAESRSLEALALDAATACLQIGMLAWLAWMDMLSSVTALAALGTACAFTVLSWLWTARRRFRLEYRGLLATTRESWRVGKWLCFNQALAALQAQITLWTVAFVMGTKATGIYIACLTVALFSNPFIIGLSNMFWGKAARTFQEGGSARLLRASIVDTAFLGAILAVYWLLILVAGETVLQFLFPGGEYAGYHHIVTLLALSQLASGIGMPPSSALAGMGFVRINSVMAIAETTVMAILAFPLVTWWGLTGAAYAVLIVSGVRAIGRWTAFVTLARSGWSRASVATDSANINEQLKEALGDGKEWEANVLDLRGCQARVFTASSGKEGSPTETLVVKVYKTIVETAEARDQYVALQRLHAALDGHSFRDWTIRVPAPITFLEEPLTLVMTMAPGQPLSEWLAEGKEGKYVGREADSIADVVAQSLLAAWKTGVDHGDLTIENILCDVPARVVSFVDPGPKAECGAHRYVSGFWDLAVHDLAHLLSHEGETLAAIWARPPVRRRRRFVEQVLRSVLAALRHEVRFAFLADLESCAQAHLNPTRQFYGLYSGWLAFKRQIALWRVRTIVAAMEAECGAGLGPNTDARFSYAPQASARRAVATENRTSR